MAAIHPKLADLSDDDRQVLESWLVEFDQRWDLGLLANRAQQIPPGSSWRLPALAEMVKIDLERQWQRGRQVSLESYLKDFPELGSPGDVSADLIQAEYEVRRQFGASVTLEDYLRRFPHQAGELARLIAQGGSSLSHRNSSSRVERSGETPEQLPEQFGRYRIIKRLGQGAMGSVYLAQDTQLKRPVALKVPDFGPHEGPKARKRFLEEARTAATLDHPYLCPVHDAGEIDGQLYLTMAYIEGKSLAALIGEQGWPPRQVAALVGKLALALQEAHAKKVIHRDLKPANVMIKTTGQRREPVIVDFGLAHRDDPDEVRLTRTGQLMGTLSYMAPEQIRGDLKEIGPACDIYALGVILYEMLTGRLPFDGTGLAVAGQILTVEPLPPSTHQSDLDPALEAICLKAMAKQVGDRYASMGDLAAALTGFLRSPTATPTQTSPAGSNSLVGQILEQLAEKNASPPLRTTPEPVASSLPLPARRRTRWPLIVAAAVFVVLMLGVIDYVATNKGRITIVVNGPKAVVRDDLKVGYEPTRNNTAKASREKPPEVAPKPGTGADSPVPPKPIPNSVGIKLMLIPAGEFLMGSSKDVDIDAGDDELPRHRVRITRPFYLGVTEVTQGQYRAVTGQSPSHFKGSDDLPVEHVSWFDAVNFCNAMSRAEGLPLFYRVDALNVAVTDWKGTGYRLPTEAEWEYAARGTDPARYSFRNGPAGLSEYTWFHGNSGLQTHPVGQKRPTAFGLFDMHGNVSEWCFDGYQADFYARSPVDDPVCEFEGATIRVTRGGGWHGFPHICRTAGRGRIPPGNRGARLGFRLARVQSADGTGGSPISPVESPTRIVVAKPPVPSPGPSLETLDPLPPGRERTLKSLSRDTLTDIQLVNHTSHEVQFYWLDYQGKRQYQGTIPPGGRVLRSSAATHPFVLTDSKGKGLAIFIATRRASIGVLEERAEQSSGGSASAPTRAAASPSPP